MFDTTATTVDVVSWSNITALFPTLDDIGMYIDGVYYTTISHGGNGGQTTRLALADGSKRITLVNGAQSQLAPIRGTFVVSVGADAAMTQIFPATANRIAIYGDSIAVGANANNASQQSAWAMQLRAYRGTDSTVVEAQGFRSLYDDAVDATARAAFVAKIVALSPTKLWMAIGTNDYGIPKQSSANFGTKYAAVLDDLHTALPSLAIYCQTPTVRTSEVANSYGDTLGAYRTQIATAVSTRGAYATLVDGTTLIALGDLADDVHPSTAGHGVYYTAVKAALGI